MNQLSTSEKDLGFGTIGSKNGGTPNISKTGQNTRPVGGGTYRCPSLYGGWYLSDMGATPELLNLTRSGRVIP